MTTPVPRDGTNAALPVRDLLTAAQQASETLSALDWVEYRCRCPEHPDGCGNTASYAVHIHAVDACNGEGLDPFGNRIELRCSDCTSALRAYVSTQLARINHQRAGRAHCLGCGAPLVKVSDVVRSAARL
jgi:hypothetical protein